MKKEAFIIITLLLILLPLINAQPTTTQTNVNINVGLQIQTQGIYYFQQNINHTFQFHVFNISNGFILDNSTTNCTFHLYNKTGELQYTSNNLDFTHESFNIELTPTNFSNSGSYSYYIHCNNTIYGGFTRENFEVTPTGIHLETSEANLYIIILIATFILFLGFLYPAITLPYSNKTNKDGSITRITKAKYLKLLSIWFAYGFLMWFLQTLNGISSSFITLTYLSNFITSIFTYTQWFSVGITFLILIIIFVEIWKDIILNETIKKYGKAIIDKKLQ